MADLPIPDPPSKPDATDDKLRQSQHAQEVRDRREADARTPEAKQEQAIQARIDAAVAKMQAQLERTIATRVDAAVDKALAGFTIQNGDNVTISGSGRNITISAKFPKERQLQLFSTFVCIDTGAGYANYNAQVYGILGEPV